jgi:hypothetical protein
MRCAWCQFSDVRWTRYLLFVDRITATAHAMARLQGAALILALMPGLVLAYYMPGTYPQEFWAGDTLNGEPPVTG